MGGLHRRGASLGEYERLLAEAGFAEVGITFTHEVADGLHGAIVTAMKPEDAPSILDAAVASAARRSGCC